MADIAGRLARIEGQVRGLRAMHAEARECAEILDQVKSVQVALRGVAVELVHEHAADCLAKVEDEEARRRHMKVIRRFARS